MNEIFYPFTVQGFKKKTFLEMVICTLVFVGMAVPFKVMVLIEGFTEVRPVNAVPVVAGLMLGPVGAWGCAFGNLIADFFGTLSSASILGFFGNFIAAYLPYKVWYYIKGTEAPNIKNFKNIGVYILASASGALATGVFIAGGLDVFLGIMSPQIFWIIVLNDFLFPVFLGMPVLIVLTCDDVKMKALKPITSPKHLLLKLICGILLGIIAIAILFVFSGLSTFLPMPVSYTIFIILLLALFYS